MPPVPNASELVRPSLAMVLRIPISTSPTPFLSSSFSLVPRELPKKDHLFDGTELPYQQTGDLAEDADGKVRMGDDWQFRTGYTVVSLFCMLVLALMLGSRAKHLRFNNVKAMNFMRFLVLALYAAALNFVAAAAVVETGIGINSPSVCGTGIYICLAFYISNKVLMYMFMIERAHSIRAPYERRFRDWVWCVWMFILAVGFTILAVLAFVYPLAEVNNIDKKCRIGLPKKVSITLLCYDTIINFSLTAIFIWLLRPLLAFHRSSDPTSTNYFRHRITKSINTVCSKIPLRLPQSDGPYQQAVNHNLVTAVEWLVWKTLAGTILIVIPTIANLSLLTVMGGREQGWLCFTICTVDVTWAVCVIHWLTVDPLEVESRPSTQATLRSAVTDTEETEAS